MIWSTATIGGPIQPSNISAKFTSTCKNYLFDTTYYIVSKLSKWTERTYISFKYLVALILTCKHELLKSERHDIANIIRQRNWLNHHALVGQIIIRWNQCIIRWIQWSKPKETKSVAHDQRAEFTQNFQVLNKDARTKILFVILLTSKTSNYQSHE